MEMTQAKQEYAAFLKGLSTELITESKAKRAAGDQYEAVLDTIRLNVVNIFTQMFNKAQRDIDQKGGPLLEIYKAENDPANVQLEKVYMGLLEKISGQWVEALKEAKEFDDHDNITKEEAKIAMADQLHGQFRQYFDL